MTPFATPNPQLDAVRRAVLAMPMAQTLRLTFDRIEAGVVELRLPVQDGWCFQPEQLQATAVFAAGDFAAVAAAGTLLPPGWVNATMDATLKLLAPARGSQLIARGRVLHANAFTTTCMAEVFALHEGRERLCAVWMGSARNIDTARSMRA